MSVFTVIGTAVQAVRTVAYQTCIVVYGLPMAVQSASFGTCLAEPDNSAVNQ